MRSHRTIEKSHEITNAGRPCIGDDCASLTFIELNLDDVFESRQSV